ncbi:velvet factor-domain-containing protein [Mycena olivaceomarginata]|nr:velvet factor-domain-containing protein [Mycena olivaceomarginata]
MRPFKLTGVQRRSYQLNIVQHPQKAAEFGYANLSRLPLTPTMVVRLTVRDANGNSIVPQDELPFLIAHLSLFTENGIASLDMGSSTTGQPPPILYGSLVSSLNHLEDHNGNMGLFFLFPDVSIRWRGRFQLGVTLLRISRIQALEQRDRSWEGLKGIRPNTSTVETKAVENLNRTDNWVELV